MQNNHIFKEVLQFIDVAQFIILAFLLHCLCPPRLFFVLYHSNYDYCGTVYTD